MLFEKRTKTIVKWVWILISVIIIFSMVASAFVGVF